MAQKITEEMKVHEQWYEQARKVTHETLPEFVRHVCDDYEHDYGTICHAVAAAALAGAYAVEHAPCGGITGFQSGAVMWEFIRAWQRFDGPLRLVQYDDMLYPQHEYKFVDKTIDRYTWERLQKLAMEHLTKENYASPRVIAHWQSIVDGVVPFGYSLNEQS